MDKVLHKKACEEFRKTFGKPPDVASFAPGRIEVLGNHTDYNEGFVLSAAINLGTFFLASTRTDRTCRLVAGDIMKEAVFPVDSPAPSRENSWANYVKGVLAGLPFAGRPPAGFNGFFLGNLPLAAGLSSSAALEISAGLALSALYKLDVPPRDLARIGQKAEHEFAGVRCGLLDQLSSLFGKEDSLVMTDFRSLDVKNVPFRGGGTHGKELCFLICNTNVKHTLVDSEYNERRSSCEKAAAFFKATLKHPVSHLRDVSWAEWQEFAPQMDARAAKRAAHVIGENARVLNGAGLLAAGKFREFGRLMFESHESSMNYFENSCPELDFLVDTARSMPQVLGARLSGGGFGGSVLMLTGKDDVEAISAPITAAYEKRFRRQCTLKAVMPAGAARVVNNR